MILTNRDIRAFERQVEKQDFRGDEVAAARFLTWLNNNPQVLMAGGFQEYVGAHDLPLYGKLVSTRMLIDCPRPAFRDYSGRWLLVSSIMNDRWDAYSLESLREFELKHLLHTDAAQYDSVVDLFTTEELLAKARKIAASPLADATVFVSPKLWTPHNQTRQKSILQSSAVDLIRAIQDEKLDLRSIHWRSFEDIVAEILRHQGLEIHAVRESPQGGRDIIARSELIPGMEVLTIAIEVKHRPVVDRPMIQQALYQNRHFPALMFVTSGRFTAGVLQEVSSPTNTMRLFLKDGVAISELIRTYGLSALEKKHSPQRQLNTKGHDAAKKNEASGS